MIVELPSGGGVTVEVAGDGGRTFLLAHGAGTDQYHRSIVGIREALATAGLRVVTFNYPYTEAGRRRPDRPEVLYECHATVASWAAARHLGPLVMGGRSMGGRIATMLAASGHPVAALVLYAYPLHPAGRPDRLRVAHLLSVRAPMLFFQGTRDALSRSEHFDRHIRTLTNADVVEMEGADHSFRGRGWAEPGLYEFLAQHTVDWLDGAGVTVG